MCIAPKVVAAPAVAPGPTLAQTTAAAVANSNSLVNQNRSLVAKRQGTFGNIKTTPLGDASYNTSAVARFGSMAA